MAYQTIFERYEMKYLLTPAQKEAILRGMQPYMQLDQYGRSTIRNLYFDTDTFRLVRRSLEKPAYKEKLRVRSYQPAQGQTPVFVELKKKYRSIVYKRRLVLPWEPVFQSFQTGEPLPVHSQIAREIEYFRQYYAPLSPKVYLSYEREAYYALDGSDFRVTFDEAIRYRTQQLTLEGENQGQLLLPPRPHLNGAEDLRRHPPVDVPPDDPAGGVPYLLFQVRHRLPQYATNKPRRTHLCLIPSFPACLTPARPRSLRFRISCSAWAARWSSD